MLMKLNLREERVLGLSDKTNFNYLYSAVCVRVLSVKRVQGTENEGTKKGDSYSKMDHLVDLSVDSSVTR
jgi:hypothetical protein